MRERPFKDSQRTARGRAKRKGRGRRKGDAHKRANQDWGPQVAPFGQTTDPDKSFRGDGSAGGRETLFQKGPLPLPKEFPNAVPADA